MKILKRIIVAVLIASLEFGSFPAAAFAQASAQPTAEVEKEEFSSLVTETKPSESVIFTGVGHGVNSIIPALADMQASNISAGFESPAKVHKLAKEDFRPNEEIDVVIENGAHKEYKTELIDAIGNKVALETSEVENGAAKVITVEQPSAFRPGKYTLRVSDNRGGVSEQDFSWGVLAVNPDKSVYTPNEIANLAIGVLDEGGDMVCDAQVELQITDPHGVVTSLSTDNGKIIVNEECKSHDFTLKPDYETSYQTGGIGKYSMILKSQTLNGAHSIADSFEVRENVPFDVKRISATRIYPPNTYPVTLEITANQDFEGTVSETVPGNFKIARPGEEVKTDSEKVDAIVAADLETSKSVDILAPDSLPKKSPVFQTDAILSYQTINTVGDFNGGKAVLGASIPGIGMPFSGNYPVTQEFGQSLVYDEYGHGIYDTFGMHGHDGIDFAMPEGTPILAVDSGKVLLAGNGDYGITVVIEHSWGRSYYGHLSSVEVKEGDEIPSGTQIARSGNTGLSTGPHLHFGIKPHTNESENGYYGKVDPSYYIGMKQSATAVLGASTKFDDSINAAPSTDVQILNWRISVKKGDIIKIGYNYLAPRISPQFYTLGPAVFTDTTGKEIFHEERKWQIASDALDYKFKRGTFQKSVSTTCAAPCTQTVSGVGFKPKAVIFEWTNATTEGFSAHQDYGMGFATATTSAGLISERSVSYCAEDNIGTADTSSRQSDTKAIMIQSTDCATGTAIVAEADFISFDTDGFTISWSTNNTSQYIINYTVVGGSDVSNTMVSSFTLTTAAGLQTVTEPGFQPDFVMFLGSTTEANNDTRDSGEGGKINIGFASSPSKEAAVTMFSDDNLGTTDSYRQQSTTESILLLTDAGAADAVADLSSWETNGFTVNKTNAPAANIEIFYLAIKGGQYDVGAFTQSTATGTQSVYTGFRPSGIMTLAASQSASTAITATGTLSTGGASRDSGGVPWCNDTTGVKCTAVDTQLNAVTDWCNDTTGITCTSSWSTRRKVTFNNASASADLTNFPVLVKLSSASGNIDFNKTQFNGQDIRFVDPTNPNAVLSHEIESWNEPAGQANVWVKVPQLDASSSADFIWMYYGNANAPDGQDATNVWDSNYAAVYHMKEDPSITNCATNKEVCDSTSNANNADNTALVSGSQVSGKVNGSIDFNGTTQHLLAPDSNSLDISPNISISAWIKADDVSTWHEILAKHVTFGNDANFGYQIEDTSKQEFYFKIGATYYTHMSNTALATGQWYHVAVSYDQSNVRFYLNGVADGTTARAVALPTTTEALYIGNNTATERFDGTLDEIRISNSIRPSDWIEAEFLTSNDRMNTYGSEQLYSETQSTSGWTARKKISFNNLASAEDLENFPVLVTLTAGKIDYTKTQNSGQDIRFVDPNDPNTVLPHEIDTWNESGTSYVWVKVPKINKQSNTDHIWMYYGNPTASDGQDGSNVWNSDYKAVYHMKESGSGAAGEFADATRNNLDGQGGAGTAGQVPTQTTGQIGNANDFDGADDNISLGMNGAFNLTTGGSLHAWVRPDTTGEGTFGRIIDKSSSSSGIDGYYMIMGGTTSVDLNINNVSQVSGNSGMVPFSTWTYVVATYDGTNMKVYVNGQQDATLASAALPPNTDRITYIGNRSGASDRSFDGRIDEVRFSSIPRSADWIEAEYLTMNNTMNIFGSEEIYGSGAFSYSQSSVWSDDLDAQNTPLSSSNSNTDSTKVIRFAASPTAGGAARTLATASLESFDPTGFTLNWTEADTTSRLVLYWAVGSVTASQEDYRWYKNANAITPGSALEDENSSTILAKNKPYARLRASVSTGGNGMNASTQGFKLQYAANQAEAAIGGTTDWCNDTTGVTCTAPAQAGEEIQASTPTDWCNDTTGVTCTSEWSSRRKITFNNASSSAALTNFPVLVKLDSTRINYNKTQNSGQDLRFVDPADQNTTLPHEIESWNESGTSYVWVKVPTIDGRSTVDSIWMYYGNSTVSDGQDATNVWDSNYKLVQHFEETGSCPVTSTDSTTNANNATCSGSPTSTTGPINTARNFTAASSQYLDQASAANDLQSGDISISTWFNPTATFTSAATANQNIISLADPSSTNDVNLYLDEVDGSLVFGIHGSTTTTDAFTGTSWTGGTWYFVTGTYNESTNLISIYVNGLLAGTGTLADANRGTTNSTDMSIGRWFSGTPNYLNASVDEVRASNSVRSADWVKAEYLTSVDQFNTYGTEFTQNDIKQSSSGWQYRKKISFNNASSSAALTDFPVLVKLDQRRIDYNKTQDDGGDIRFVDPSDNTTVLAHEIESWNENGTSYVWVKVPSLAAGTEDYIWMYYGNPGASDGQSITNVWDSSHVGVWHLKEDPTGSSPQHQDSTSNNFDATVNGTAASTDLVNGKVDGARQIRTTGDARVSDNDSLTPSQDMTVSGWIRISETGSDATLIYKNHSVAPWNTYAIGFYGGIFFFSLIDNASNYAEADYNGPVRLGEWYHLSGVRSGSTIQIYVNGSNANTTTDTLSNPNLNSNSDFLIGNIYTSEQTHALDEVRLSNDDRSTDWIEAEYLSETDQMNMYGEEQPYAISGTAVAGWRDVADPWCNDTSGIVCNTSWGNRKRITFNNPSQGNMLFSEGFENGNLNSWSTGGSVSIATDTVLNGRYSAYIPMAGTGSYAMAPLAEETTSATLQGHAYVASVSTQTDIIGIYNTNSEWFILFRNPTGYLCIWNGVTSIDTCSTTQTVPTGSWHHYKLDVTIGSTTGELKAYVDGTLVPDLNLTNQDTGTYALSGVSFGDGTDGRTSTIYYDNISVTGESKDLTNFPVLVKLDSSRIDYGKTQNDGDDIRFVDPDDPNTVLNHEIETWNESGDSFVWVQVPQLDANSTSDSIWMYYGNESATNGQNATSVWDSNFVSVHHLNETVTDEASSGTHLDSTTPAENGTQAGNDDKTGRAGKGQDLDGTNDQISLGDDSDLDFGANQDFTVTIWINTSMGQTAGVWPAVISKETGTAGYAIVVQDANTDPVWYAEIVSSSTYYTTAGGSDITDGSWHKLTMQRSGTQLITYQDGAYIGTSTTPTASIANAVPFMLGSFNGSDYVDGILDELKVSNTARSADWIKAEYLTESDQMNTFGSEETQASAIWKFKDNTSVSNGTQIFTSVLGTSAAGGQLTYQESNLTTLNPTAIAAGEKREFDFSLDGSLASNRRTYYFRLVNADGTPLTNYTRYPSITVGVPNQKVMRGGKFFNYKSSQPFTF